MNMRNLFGRALPLSLLLALSLPSHSHSPGTKLIEKKAAQKPAAAIPNKEVLPPKTRWKMVWSDEFDKPGRPDPKKWKFQTGGTGWGNKELQYYTDRSDNARVEKGNLVIEARKEVYKGMAYTSARLNSNGKGWTYGRFEIRAKVPRGRGTWPAIWMMPVGNGKYSKKNWPDNGEIDIMEHVGFDQGVIHGSFHTKNWNWIINTQKTKKIDVLDCSSEFHTYALEWTKDELRLFVDAKDYYSYKNPHTNWKDWPFNQPFYLILNIAVGGSWGGEQGVDDTIFPERMFIDYVRAYKQVQSPVAAALTTATN
jgi:licheninase